MKKISLAAIFAVVMILLVGPSAPALAHPDIEVLPLEHDFGDVEVGTSGTTIITISNINTHPLTIFDINLKGGSSPDFSVTMAPDLPADVDPDNSVEVEITFSPSSEGYSSAILEITSDDPDKGFVTVSLGGVGIAVEPPPVTIADILAFFDASVDEGTLEGRGRLPRMARARSRAMRNILEAAGDLIEGGYMGWACFMLERAYLRSDGLPRPPDFVVGEARAELNGMILQLMADLGCE